MNARLFACSFVAATLLLPAGFSFAQTANLSPTICDQLFNLPQGTITTAASSQYLNTQTCNAYQYLIARYNPGPCSTVGFTNAKVQGITSLNTTFAQDLTNMLQAANAAGFNITINSAFRTVKGEQCANPGGFSGNSAASMHTKGLAADLSFPGDSNSAKDCDSGIDSPAYNWVAANAKNFGLGLYDQLHSHVNGECNHVEMATAVAGGIGPGGGGSSAQPVTSGVISATQNPLLGSSPLLSQPASLATNPFSTTPIAATPVSATAATAACTPQYFCSASTIYYESSACVTQVFQACQYGCSGTVCTPSPAQSASSSLTVASNPVTTNAAAPITTSAISETSETPETSGTSATAVTFATSAPLTLNLNNASDTLSQTVQENPGEENTPLITTIATASAAQSAPAIGQSTFSSSDYSEPLNQTLSPLQQILASLKNALTGFLTYFQSLGQQSVPSQSAE